jgi:hypothetical protein
MAFTPETPTYEPGIIQLETTTKVLGGLGGPSNEPLRQLANRTAWLKQALENLESGGGPFEYNASAGTLPVGGSDGAGVAGIRRKDYYFVTVPGVVSGVTLQIGDALIAKQDDADHISEFIISQSNAELATPTVIGMVKLVQNLAGGSQADACLSVAGLLTLFAQINSPTFTGAPKVPTPAAGDNSTLIANTAWVLARLTSLSDTLNNAISAEATVRANEDAVLQSNIDDANAARLNGDNALQTNINNEAAARIAGDNALAALIPSVKTLAYPGLTLNLTSGDVDINPASLPGIRLGFWCTIRLDADASNVGVLSYRLPSLGGSAGVYNICRQVDTGYGTNVNNSEHSWFCPLPPAGLGRFSMGHYIGSGATAEIKILAYI